MRAIGRIHSHFTTQSQQPNRNFYIWVSAVSDIWRSWVTLCFLSFLSFIYSFHNFIIFNFFSRWKGKIVHSWLFSFARLFPMYGMTNRKMGSLWGEQDDFHGDVFTYWFLWQGHYDVDDKEPEIRFLPVTPCKRNNHRFGRNVFTLSCLVLSRSNNLPIADIRLVLDWWSVAII